MRLSFGIWSDSAMWENSRMICIGFNAWIGRILWWQLALKMGMLYFGTLGRKMWLIVIRLISRVLPALSGIRLRILWLREAVMNACYFSIHANLIIWWVSRREIIPLKESNGVRIIRALWQLVVAKMSTYISSAPIPSDTYTQSAQDRRYVT